MREGVITAYAYLWNWFSNESKYKDQPILKTNFTDLGKRFNLSMGNNTDYDKLRTIITILCGAGIIDYDIKTIKDLSNAVHEIRDDYAVKLVKLHNKYWKNIDPEDKEQVI